MTPVPMRRPAARARGLLLVAALSLFVVTDGGYSGAATPPAELVSVPGDLGLSVSPSISGDGSFVAFDQTRTGIESSVLEAQIRNRVASTSSAVPFNSSSYDVVISRDGCHVAFVTGSTSKSVLAYDRCVGTTPRVVFTAAAITSVPILGETAISAHGRFVAVNNGVYVTRIDRDPDRNGVLDDVTPTATSSPTPGAHASLGDETVTSRMAYAELRSGQVVLWDPTLPPSNPQSLILVSAVDGTTSTAGNGSSTEPSMTPDARYVTFTSAAPNLSNNPNQREQVLLRDVTANRTTLVSRSTAGVGGNGYSAMPSISADGTQIAFGTTATDLLTPGPGGLYDPPLAALDLLVARSTGGWFAGIAYDRVSLMPNGTAVDPRVGVGNQDQPVISSNGRWVAFRSALNAELQFGTRSSPRAGNNRDNVYVIGRPADLAITAVDFGALLVGTTSSVRFATVTNTGISSVLPSSISTGGDFSVAGGGTCAVGVWISPSTSCTVALRFLPSAEGPRSAGLTVAESGFAAISRSSTLTGVGSGTPVVEQTTTIPGVVVVTTTIPRIAALTITPTPATYGTSVVGMATEDIEFVVRSTGNRSAPISFVTLSGAHPNDFTIIKNDCEGANLPPGAGCGVYVTFTPTDAGLRTATLTAGSALATAAAQLDGTGIYQPTLRLLPDVVALGDVTVAAGAGFPPNLPVQIQWLGDATVRDGIADPSGNVSIQVPVRRDEQLGPRTMIAIDQPGVYTGVTTPGLIVARSMHPPTSQNPALPNFPSLVVRG